MENMDYLIKLDRSRKPIYPDWVERIVYPEYELSGPNEFDLKNVERWLHKQQKVEIGVAGYQIYDQLQNGNLLKDCLNLADLLAIQEKGTELFQYLYKDCMVFGWKSIAEHPSETLFVPSLDQNLKIHWDRLESEFKFNHPALMLKN